MTRGDVVRARLPRGAGHEQHGERYAVVVQTDGLSMLSTVLVAPTSQSRLTTSFRPTVEVRGESTQVLTDHLRSLDHRRLGNVVGRLTPTELGEVDDALRLVLAL